MSKKSKYILGAILSLMILGGCEKRSEDNITYATSVSETVSETEASAAAAIPAKAETEKVTEASSPQTEATETVSEQEEISEEQAALEKLIIEASETDGKIVYPLFGDFDGDGINELIAFHKTDTEGLFGTIGAVWFASGDKAYKLLNHSDIKPYFLRSSGRTILCIGYTKPGTLGGVEIFTRCFTLKNSEIKEIETDRTVSDIDGEFGDFIGEDITGGDGCVVFYDGEYPHGEGITYKKYWYYYIEDKITGYYGKEITEEEFLKYGGAKEFLDNLEKDGCTLDNILKRGNGIINVNYSSESRDEKREATYMFFNYKTFLYRSGKLTEYDDSYSGGQYEPCLEHDRTEQTDFERFSEMIYDTAEGDGNSFIRERFYGDHDNDGRNELYAYYGTDENFSLWFADESGARQASEEELAGISQTL